MAVQGSIRLVADHSQVGGNSTASAITDSPVVDLGVEGLDEAGASGIIVRGVGRLSLGQDGLIGVALYGTGVGARVVWVAAAVSR
jgi:hypothetical protein